jgi:uncharacterized protein YbgA (DUF1722 family)
MRKFAKPVVVVSRCLEFEAVRFGDEYLSRQTFFSPYAEDLMTISDSGKGGV